jgi:hypothetical protein
VTANTTLTFSLVVTDNRGLASTASTVNITVTAPVAGNVTVSGRVRYARPLFATNSPFGLIYASPSLMPSRGVIVRAMNGGTEISRTTSEDDGDYSLTVPGGTNITIQVMARLLRDNTQPLPRWDVRVQNGTTGNNPYTYSTAAFSSGAGVTQNVDIPMNINAAGTATGTRASGPFAALDTIYEGIQLVLTGAPTANFPALIVDWGSQTEGTFFDGSNPQHIALLSDLTQDTDEYDEHVVAHEFGHYIEHNFSRADNIGGAHGLGDRLDIRVAFGEGFGYAFAAMVHQDPNARDSFVHTDGSLRSGGFNVETNPTTPASGQDDVGCWCSESSVWAILYDLYDSGAEAGDTLSLGFAPIWSVLVGNQRTTPAFTSIFSFISALKAARPGDAAAIDALVAPQNIDTIADAFGTGETHTSAGIPTAAQLPLYTTITAGTPVVVSSTDNAGTYNTLGNHRFLRFTPASSGNVTVNVTTSNSDPQADPDFRVWRAGALVLNAESADPQEEEGSFNAVAGTTYVLDVYDCANGCGSPQGTPGEYNLTVTIN